MSHPALQSIGVFILLAFSVTISTPAWGHEQLGRGHQWVRSHPYTIIGDSYHYPSVSRLLAVRFYIEQARLFSFTF